MYRIIKQNVFEIIQPAENGRLASKIFDSMIMLLIFLSVVSVFISTFSIPRKVYDCLEIFEVAAILIFTAEYLLRVWTADLLYPELSPFRARIRYCRSGMALIDLFAILPFYLPLLLPSSMLGLRALRLLRLLRIFKLNRYSDALGFITGIFKQKKYEIYGSVFFVFLLMLVASLLIYFAENEAQPDKFQNAFSGMWWAVATLTTVGYGDIYPITPVGKILGAFIAIFGIGLVAIPTGILSAGLMEHLDTEKNKKLNDGNEKADSDMNYCPHCGKKLK